jgi:hypothetical protein
MLQSLFFIFEHTKRERIIYIKSVWSCYWENDQVKYKKSQHVNHRSSKRNKRHKDKNKKREKNVTGSQLKDNPLWYRTKENLFNIDYMKIYDIIFWNFYSSSVINCLMRTTAL